MTISTDDALAPLRRLADLQRRSDELLVKSARRAAYDELRGRLDTAAELGDKDGQDQAARALAEEFGDDVPPKVTDEELLDYHRDKRDALLDLVEKFGSEEFGAALDQAEAELREQVRRAPAEIELVSFGFLHGPAPEADLVVDMRRHFRDPHVNPGLRELTAEHELVMRAVFDTPGVRELALTIRDAIDAFRAGPSAGTVRVAVGCAGGRHRSAAMVNYLAMQYSDEIKVTAEHRDIHRPVIER